MRLQRESCVNIVNLCRDIVGNYSQTSLQLSHSSEIGALLKGKHYYLIPAYDFHETSYASR